MSSSPVATFGISGSAAGSPSALRQSGEYLDDLARGTASVMPRDGNAIAAELPADVHQASNIIELASPLRRTGTPDGTPARVNPRAVALLVRIADTLAVVVAGALSYAAQPGLSAPLDATVAFTALAVMAMLVRSPYAEPRLLHDSLRRPLARRLADGALRTLLPFLLTIVFVLVLLPEGDAARSGLVNWLALWAAGSLLGVCGVRCLLSLLVSRWRSRGRLRQAVAIFGTGDIAERLLERVKASSDDAIELVGVFDDRSRRRIASPGLRSLAVGTADDLIALSRHRDIDRVIVALPHSAEHRVVEVMKKLRLMPVEISLAPDLVGFTLPCREPDMLGGLPLLEVYGQPLTFGQVLLKGAFDKAVAGLALVLGAPLYLALALAIKLDSPGPVLFRQNRHGFGDRMIGVYKFRTMYADAADYNGELQASRQDPRITRIGHFLRRWSLDELPQLLNVLRGEMSIVGPRPHAVSMKVEERSNRDIVPDYALRHHVKPGITGWAQVNGCHGPVETEEALRARIRYDLDYINNWSFWFDFEIILRTVRIVLGQRHAY